MKSLIVLSSIMLFWKEEGIPSLLQCVQRIRRSKWQSTPQYFCLKNPMDRGAWWAAVHGIARSPTWLSSWSHTFSVFTFSFYLLWLFLKKGLIYLAVPGLSSRGGVFVCVPVDPLAVAGSSVFGTHGFLLLQLEDLVPVWLWAPLPVIKPTSPALEGGFLTTGPPGKSLTTLLLNTYCNLACLCVLFCKCPLNFINKNI